MIRHRRFAVIAEIAAHIRKNDLVIGSYAPATAERICELEF